MAAQPLITPLTYATKCRLCGHEFKGKPLNPPDLKGQPDGRMNKVGEALFRHMWETDAQHKHFAVMCVLVSGFLMEDPAALQFSAGMRYVVFQATRRHWVPDEVLTEKLSALTTPEAIEQAFRDLRDFLTETGPHAPQFPPVVQST